MKSKLLLGLPVIFCLLVTMPTVSFGDNIATAFYSTHPIVADSYGIGAWCDEGIFSTYFYNLTKSVATRQVVVETLNEDGTTTTSIATEDTAYNYYYSKVATPAMAESNFRVATSTPNAPTSVSVPPDLVVTEWRITGHMHFSSQYEDSFE
ncbi:MAG: hypothetical protein PHW69_06515 [Elusimicrobiaceae bacterium]|nr:hypothetical protein [Elusimicrobiaceae bacterium]